MRPPLDFIMMGVAQLLSKRATCVKRAVGCVLTDSQGRIIGSGYNGVPSGAVHCTETPCHGAGQMAGSDTCQAVHAEMNALMYCKDVQTIDTCYVTVFPCNHCMKALLNTSCQRIVYSGVMDAAPAQTIWHAMGRDSEWFDPKNSFV